MRAPIHILDCSASKVSGSINVQSASCIPHNLASLQQRIYHIKRKNVQSKALATLGMHSVAAHCLDSKMGFNYFICWRWLVMVDRSHVDLIFITHIAQS